MNEPRSLASRARMAVGLLIGFYLLAFALVALLLFVPYAFVVYTDLFPLMVIIPCLVAAFLILAGIIPRPDRFEPPGLRLDPQRHPELFQVIDEVAEATEQAAPAEVYLILDFNAWVMERGGWMGFGSRRVLAIGLPLMAVLTIPQLRAVIAHEFGHYHGGDTKLGPWVYKTRLSLERTRASLSSKVGTEIAESMVNLVKLPFEIYTDIFLEITQSISRQQEFTADQLAARVAGTEATVGGLLRFHGAGLGYEGYMIVDLSPVLQWGYRPPFVDGFLQYLTSPGMPAAINDAIDKEREQAVAHPHDSHPGLDQRISALGGERAGAGESTPAAPSDLPPDSPPGSPSDSPSDSLFDSPMTAGSITLLNDPDAAEAALFQVLLTAGGGGGEMTPVSWDDVALLVWQPEWQRTVDFYAEVLSGMTPGEFPEIAKQTDVFASRLPPGLRHQMSNADRTGQAAAVLNAATALALIRDGWRAEVRPGEPATFRKGNKSFQPLPAIGRLVHHEMEADEWMALVTDVGIADVDLGELAKADALTGRGAASTAGRSSPAAR